MRIETFLPFAVLLGLFALLAVRYLYDWIYRFAERTAQDVVPYLQKIDLSAVRNLFDPQEEKYLKLNIPEREFRKSQWKRFRLAQQYVSTLSHNARVIQEWSKFERVRSLKTMDTTVRRASLELNIVCAQCRICGVIVRLQLHVWLLKMAVLPFLDPPSFQSLVSLGSMEMVSFYEKIRRCAFEVGGAYGDHYQTDLARVI